MHLCRLLSITYIYGHPSHNLKVRGSNPLPATNFPAGNRSQGINAKAAEPLPVQPLHFRDFDPGLGGFRVGGEVAAITLAGVKRCPLLADSAAGVLPNPPGVVPVEAKLSENAGDGRRLLIGELYPNPLPDNFGHFKKAGCFTAKQGQQFLSFQFLIGSPEGEINLRSVFSARLFGSAQEPFILFFLCGGFHGLFFVLCCSSRPVAL
jgi:hypothetical protein